MQVSMGALKHPLVGESPHCLYSWALPHRFSQRWLDILAKIIKYPSARVEGEGGRGGHLKGGGASHQGERKVRGDKGRRLVQVITEEEEPLRAGAPWAVVGLPGGSIVHSWVSLASCIYPGLQASGLAASCPCCAGPPCGGLCRSLAGRGRLGVGIHNILQGRKLFNGDFCTQAAPCVSKTSGGRVR